MDSKILADLFLHPNVTILLSPGYGAGWSSWVSDEKKKAFLLVHPGLIEALEKQKVHDERDTPLARDRTRNGESLPLAFVEAAIAAEEALPEGLRAYFRSEDVPYEVLLAFPKFVEDWKAAFPEEEYDIPLGGLYQLETQTVNLFRFSIRCHDGFESVSEGRTFWDQTQ